MLQPPSQQTEANRPNAPNQPTNQPTNHAFRFLLFSRCLFARVSNFESCTTLTVSHKKAEENGTKLILLKKLSLFGMAICGYLWYVSLFFITKNPCWFAHIVYAVIVSPAIHEILFFFTGWVKRGRFLRPFR